MERNTIRACDLLRSTATGRLESVVYRTSGALAVVTNDGELRVFDAGATVMVIESGRTGELLVEQLLDRSELGIHAGWSARVDGSAIRTVFDIRAALARKDVGEDPIPF